jgi:trehalose 6-phosphate synthase
MLVGDYLKRRNLGLHLAYFHHIPFPSPDIFANLPSGKALLRALLRFDRLGFQTHRDKQNFIRCVRHAFGRKPTLRHVGSNLSVHFEGTRSTVCASAASIDSRHFASLAVSPSVTARVTELEATLGKKRILLSVDRLDYTKGLLPRLSAYRILLEKHPELHRTIALLQLVIPSREQIPEYEDLRVAIERRVSEINGAFGQPDWTPVIYLHRSVSCEELVAFYRLAPVMLVTPIKDGMNLVAKEYCASRVDGSGALVLSRFAGAAHELDVGAFLVNPNDQEEVAHACLVALTTGRMELQARMSAMRRTVAKHDVWRWFAEVMDDNDVERMPSMIRNDTSTRAETVA